MVVDVLDLDGGILGSRATLPRERGVGEVLAVRPRAGAGDWEVRH
jgi:hypothetical protein